LIAKFARNRERLFAKHTATATLMRQMIMNGLWRLTMSNDTHFQRHLREVMEDLGLNQLALAGKMRVSQSQVSMWLRGEHEPTLHSIAIICKATDTEPNEWFDEKEIKEKK
jgi:DNA-binding transcriptional regulator YiaG